MVRRAREGEAKTLTDAGWVPDGHGEVWFPPAGLGLWPMETEQALRYVAKKPAPARSVEHCLCGKPYAECACEEMYGSKVLFSGFVANNANAPANWCSPSPSQILADVNALLERMKEPDATQKPLPKGYRLNQYTYDGLIRVGAFLMADCGDIPFAYLSSIGLKLYIDESLKDGETKEVW